MFIRQHVKTMAVSRTLCFAVTVLLSATQHCAEAQAKQATSSPKHHSVIPAPRISEWWFARQAEKIGLMSKGDIDLLMVGDSITNNFENEKVGLKVWEKYFVPLKAINLGFGGDRTEHVLWRLDHLPVLKKPPKAAVLLIGTNNIGWGSDTPMQAAEGVQAITRKLKEIYPDMNVLVLGVLPRRRNLDHPHRKQIIELNSYLPELLKDINGVTFRDIGPAFLDEKGFLSEDMMPDTTHPSEKGHEVWAKAMLPELKKMLETPYDIIVDGKLTKHVAIVGRSTRAGDGKDDKAFVLNGLYKFVYAGAGFRSSNARIHARLSMNKLGNTGAGVLVNGHWFTFDIDPDNKIGVTGPAFGKTAKVFAEAEGRIKPGVPFDVDIIVKDGILTYAINGEKVGEVKNFPTAMETVPSPDVGSVHKLGLITALRSWRADLKIYEFRVETDGEIVPLPEMQTIYKSGSATTNTYRIPALLVSKKGTLLAFAEARRNSGGDTANIDTVVRRSEDGGKNWGDEIIVFDEQDNVAGNPCPVVDQSTGRIWSLQTWNSHQVQENQTKAGFGEDSRRVFVTYSDDDGKTWAQAKDITTSAKQKHWSWYATGPGAGIQLQSGKHKGRLIIPCDHKSLPEGGPQTYHSHILYSDDHGETWHIGAQTGHGLNECEAVELENGDVMLNSRNHGVDEFHRGVSISKDGGQTFSSFRRDPTLLEPRCQASIRRYRWSNGDKPGIILFSNPARKWRDFLMLRASYDDGKTWPDARIIYPYTTAYSDITVLPDGRIAVLFERDNHTKIDLAILPSWSHIPESHEKQTQK